MRKWLGNFCHWLHRLFMALFPAGSPQAQRVELERVLASVQAVNACLPQEDPDSGTASATSGLLNGCSTIASAFSVFVLQTQVAICWLWAQISAILTRLTTDEDDIVTLQAQVAALESASPTPIPGVISVDTNSGLGVGGTATLAAGSTTEHGVVNLVFGTGASGVAVFDLVNSLGWPAVLSILTQAGNPNGSGAFFVCNYNYLGADIGVEAQPLSGTAQPGDTLDVSYSITEL